MLYIDIYLVLWILLLSFTAETFNKLELTKFFSKIYTFLAKIFKWKKYRDCCKYVKALKEAKAAESQIDSKEEFAKWAKLNRKYEKLKSSYQNAIKELKYNMVFFQAILKISIYICLYGIVLVLISVYKSIPTFEVPTGFLGPLEWMISLPYSPIGTVSVLVWTLVSFRISRFLLYKVIPNEVQNDTPDLFSGPLGSLMGLGKVVLPPETIFNKDDL